MIINQAALRGIYTGFKLLFQKAFETVKPQYEKIATTVPSTTGEENYKWLGTMPLMREWIGDRVIHNLSASDYTIRNKKFELTVAVPRDDIEDDKIGVYNPPIQGLGQSAAQHPDDMVFTLLPNGFRSACYDGKPFFAPNHVVGEGKNRKVVSNMGTKKLTMESYMEARTRMMSQTNENGTGLKIMPNLLVVPPALETRAREILKADLIKGSTNIMKDTAELLVAPELSGHDEMWFLLDTTRPVKPLIFQERRKAKFVSLTNETDENVFNRDEYVYGVDSRGNAGYAFWQMAFGSTGEVDADSGGSGSGASAATIFTRDPSDTGGDGCTVVFAGNTAYVSGEIEWYPADDSLERAAGCRVGFAFTAPENIADVSKATYVYDNQSGLVSDGLSGDPRVFWWYPLVEEDTRQKALTIDWDGSGGRNAETFIVIFNNITLQEAGPEQQGAPASATVPLTAESIQKMSKDELIALAAQNDVDISGCSNNPERAAAIIAKLGLG